MRFRRGIVRYGIIGAGMMGCEHINNIKALDGAEVVAIADPHVPSQQAALALLPKLQVFSNYKSLLDSGTCDVLVISTPNFTHAEILLCVLRHPTPYHVLVEKPLCTNIEDCYKVLEAAKARPEVLVQVGLEYRHMPPVAKLIKIVRADALGKVKMVAIREHRFPFLVKVHNWNRFNCNTGGTLVEKCCHFFDLMNLISGASPVRVIASGAQDVNHLDENYDGKIPDIIDNAYVIVEYDNGIRGLLDLCMFAEGGRNEQEICVVGDQGKGEAFVSEGVVCVGTRNGGRKGVKTIEVRDDGIRYEGLHHGSSYLEHLELLAAVRSHGGKPSSVSLYEGLLAVAMGMAAQKSIELGKPVTMREILEREHC